MSSKRQASSALPERLIHNQVAAADLEAMVGSGRYAEAIELGHGLLSRATDPQRSARIRFQLGTAHLQLGQFDQADSLLTEAHVQFETVGDRLMLAECMGTEACLAYMSQRPGAVAMAKRALELCRSLKPVPAPTEARLLYVLAGAHMTVEEVDDAIRCYLAAIETAGSVVDLRRLAKMYGDLGGAFRVRGQFDAAVRYGTRSVELLEALRDGIALARSENNLGLTLMSQGDLAGARKHLQRSLDLAVGANLEVGRSHVLLSLCELCLELGDIDQASTFAQSAMALSAKHGEALNVAGARTWLGRIAERRGDRTSADDEFNQAISDLEGLGAREVLVQSRGIYAEILERRGDIAGAYLQAKKALEATGAVKRRERKAGTCESA